MASANRPLDALYDSNYTVSGARDFYKLQGNFVIEKVPEYGNVFSELAHYPAGGGRVKGSDQVPAFVDRTFHPYTTTKEQRALKSSNAQVSGAHQYKYLRQALPPAGADAHLASQLAAVRFAVEAPVQASAPPPAEPPVKEAATQSDYRESEAQTLPWTPGYVLPVQGGARSAKQATISARQHCTGPEVLLLADLKWGDGLPGGLHEVQRLEAARAKRAFEATLPPIDDLSQLPLRQAMIEQWEAKEWAERSEEIRRLQEERLVLLQQALQVREEGIEAQHHHQLQARSAGKQDAYAAKQAAIHAARVRTIRQLAHAQKIAAAVAAPGGGSLVLAPGGSRLKPDIIDRYKDWASPVYAPLQREGHFPDSQHGPRGQGAVPEPFTPQTLPALDGLMASVPRRMLVPKLQIPCPPAKLSYRERQEAARHAEIAHMAALIEASKTMAHGVSTIYPLGEHQSTAMGAATRHGLGLSASIGRGLPGSDAATAAAGGKNAAVALSGHLGRGDWLEASEAPPLPPSRSVDAALVLLQRLLRGRAAQMELHLEKDLRLTLVRELRLGLEGRAGNQRLPEQRDKPTRLLDAIIGTAMCSVCCVIGSNDGERIIGVVDSAVKLMQQQNQQVGEEYEEPVADAAHDDERQQVGLEASEHAGVQEPSRAHTHGTGEVSQLEATALPTQAGDRSQAAEAPAWGDDASVAEAAGGETDFAAVSAMLVTSVDQQEQPSAEPASIATADSSAQDPPGPGCVSGNDDLGPQSSAVGVEPEWSSGSSGDSRGEVD